MRRTAGQRGFGFVELVLVLAILGIAGALLYLYMGSTARTVETIREERPLASAKLAADQATLGSVRSVLQVYQAQHGQWPADKAAVLALLPAPPRFQCDGNDFAYDPATGTLRLTVDDPGRC